LSLSKGQKKELSISDVKGLYITQLKREIDLVQKLDHVGGGILIFHNKLTI